MTLQSAAKLPGDIDYEYGFIPLNMHVSQTKGRGVMQLDSAGRLVVVGYSISDLGFSQIVITRLLPTGKFDQDFGVNGVVKLYVDEELMIGGVATGMAITKDDEILVCGIANRDVFVLRCLANGDRDLSFAEGRGITYLDAKLAGRAQEVGKITLQPDGKILVVYATDLRGAIARLSAQGVPDLSFGEPDGGGVVEYDLGLGALVFHKAAYIQSTEQDDRICILAEDENRATIVIRLHTNGTLDRSFGWQGYVREEMAPGSPIMGFDLCVRADGSVLFCGGEGSGFITSPLWIAQYNPHGGPDQRFNGGKPVEDHMQDLKGAVGRALLIAHDGKLVVVGGWVDGPLDMHFLIARYLSDGSARDSAFGTDGKVVLKWQGITSRGIDVAAQADGSLLVLAMTSQGAEVFRILA